VKKAYKAPQMSHTLGSSGLKRAARPRSRAGAPGKQGSRVLAKGLTKRKQGVNPFSGIGGDLNG